MFLNPRLLSGSPTMVLIGLVFAAGMAAGAALQSRIPAPVPRAPVAASSPPERERSTPEGRREGVDHQAQSAPSPWKGEGRGGSQGSVEGRPGHAPSLQDLRLANGGHPAEVLRVNDGDTFEARVHVWPGMQVTTKVRLRGIDAAEFRAQCAEEYRLATAARDALSRMLAEGSVTIGRIDFDKYGGRVVANAATRTTPDVSEALLKTGYVRAYDGGRRDGWCGG
jgi:endonuclease YncB( thermonuclease family)